MVAELAVREPTAIDARPTSGLALSFAELAMRVTQLDKFYREVMQEGTDYGVIPGTNKPSLYQPGAQMLDQIFGLSPTFEVMATSAIDWERNIPFFHYVVRCRLMSRRTGECAAEGIGSANSREDRYRWRQSKKVCPKCGIEAIGRSKAEWGGGYFCNAKNGGCGGRYKPGSREAEDLNAQASGRVENEDTASLENTLLKMSQKRAHIAATLNATGASRIFTQDVEDLPQFQVIASSSVTLPPLEQDAPQPKGVAPTPAEEARARAMVGPDPATVAALREAAIIRCHVLAAYATQTRHEKAAQIAKVTPEKLSDIQLREWVEKLEAMFPDEATADSDEDAEF